MKASATGNANFDVAGNWISGMIPKVFMTQTKKKIATMKGRNLSPFLPSCCRRIWSRTNSTPISPRFCAPLGTSFGFRKATKKKIRMIRRCSGSRALPAW